MFVAIKNVVRIPKYLIDCYEPILKFSMYKDNTYIRLEMATGNRIKVSPLLFFLIDDAITREKTMWYYFLIS
jgi:hypothetical protein